MLGVLAQSLARQNSSPEPQSSLGLVTVGKLIQPDLVDSPRMEESLLGRSHNRCDLMRIAGDKINAIRLQANLGVAGDTAEARLVQVPLLSV